jgi:hypothetical protein
VNLEQLTAALARHDADPDAVLAALRADRRRRARNRALILGAVAVTAVAVAVVVLQPWTAPTRHAVTAPPNPTGTPVANGCASMSLQQTLTLARQGGASVIIATAALTGRTATDEQVYHEMVLRNVQTLSGPSITSDSTGWVGSARGPAGPIPGADAGALWATDGHLFAIVWPARQTGTTIGPVLRIAPIVNGQVILSSAGCWDATGLAAQAYQGPLAEIPGSDSYARASGNGFHAVALATVEQLLTG